MLKKNENSPLRVQLDNNLSLPYTSENPLPVSSSFEDAAAKYLINLNKSLVKTKTLGGIEHHHYLPLADMQNPHIQAVNILSKTYCHLFDLIHQDEPVGYEEFVQIEGEFIGYNVVKCGIIIMQFKKGNSSFSFIDAEYYVTEL